MISSNHAPAAAGSTREKSDDILGILQRRKTLILAVLLAALGLGYLYFLQAPRVYQSTAQVLLIKKDVSIPGASPEPRGNRNNYGGYEDTMSTHLLLICSPLILRQAIDKYHLDNLRSLRGCSDVLATIGSQLRAVRAGDMSGTPDPNIMRLSYSGSDPGDCAAILSAIAASYQEFLGDTYQTTNEETVRLITQAKDVLDKQLSEKEAAYRKFRQEAPLLWKGDKGANLHEARMAQIETSRAEALVERAQAEARATAIEAAMKQGGDMRALALLVTHSDRKVVHDREPFEQQQLSAAIEEKQLLEEFGPDHPKVKAARNKRVYLQEQSGVGMKPEYEGSEDLLATYAKSAKHEMQMLDERLARLDRLFEEERKAAKALATVQVQEETFRSEIARTQQMFQAVIKRLQEISLIKDYGGITTRLIATPEHGVQIKPQLGILLGISGLLGLLGGLGLAYLVDLADQRFWSPDDIRAQLHLPIVGHIPFQPLRAGKTPADGASAIDPVLCTYHQPMSAAAEAYRAIRTALYFTAGGAHHRVIQVTSPHAGDGKTSVAGNLAILIADSSKRVLLIDADFRRSRVHKLFGLENAVGMSSVLRGELSLDEAVQASCVSNLWVVTSGPHKENPSDLLTSPTFQTVLDACRSRYDFIVIDSPPVLPVTDPCVIAARADGVLLVARLSGETRHATLRTKDALESVGTPVLGLVVNGVVPGKGYRDYRYGYGKYRYVRHDYDYVYGDPLQEPARNGNGRAST